jgi:hypothetical protein
VNVARGIAGVLLALPAWAAAQGVSREAAVVFAGNRMPHATAALLRSDDAPRGFALVELPPSTDPAGTAPRRPRHALRMRSEMAESAVRSLGLDASECAMLFRMNSRAATGGSTGLVLKPQMHLHCRF